MPMPQQPQAQPQEPVDPAKAEREQMKQQMDAQKESLKQQVELHSAAVDVAKAISDAYYKIDSTLTKLQPNTPVFDKLKGVRDAVFVQKGQAEAVVQEAGGSMAQSPVPAVPPLPAAPAQQPQAPAAAPTANLKSAGAIPSSQAAHIWKLYLHGKTGRAGNLSTNGSSIALHGHPIFKVEGGIVYGSWAGHPTLTTAANVNSLAILAGIGRVFSLRDGMPTAKGEDVDTKGWIALGLIK